MDENMEGTGITVLPDGRVGRKAAAAFLGFSPKTLANWQLKGKGPRSRLVGSRRFYHINDLRAWVAGRSA